MGTDLRIVKHEVFDIDMMEKLLNDPRFSKADIQRLRSYKKNRTYGNVVEVVYNFGKGCDVNELGRLYAKGNTSLQSFPREIRNPLIAKHYWDIDMENCHFSLLLKIGNDWNIKIDNIRYYVENREKCLQMVSGDRKIAKTVYLKVAYGGKVSKDENNVDDVPSDADLTILRLIEVEVKSLMDMCYSKYEQYHTFISKRDNKKASLFSLILQTEERKCLLALDSFLKMNGRQADILIHDGLEVRKLDNESSFPDSLLRDGERYIKEVTGHTHKLVQKPIQFNHQDTVHDTVIIDDIYATRAFIHILGDKIVRDSEEVYFFNENNGMYEKGQDAFFTAISKVKEDMIFIDSTDQRQRIFNYGGVLKNMMAIYKLLLSQLPDTNFISKNIDTSMGKLLFADGIYNFRTGLFSAGFNSKIVFFKRINRIFPKIRDTELIRTVNDILFVNAFDEGDGRLAGEYMKKSLTIGLVGDYFRKKFYFSTGQANCGKSMMVTAFRNAFEGYIDEFDANNLLYQPNNTQDEAKRLSWVKDLIGVRLAFSNECRISSTNSIDGNIIKTLASGSDSMKIRGNYENQKTFVNRSTMMFLSNDCPSISPSDSGISERCKFIRYQLRFVNNPTQSDERIADPTIKVKFQQDDYKDALFYTLVDTYKHMTDEESKIGGYINEPTCVIQETTEWIKDENSNFLERLNERFEITNNPDDYVECKRIVSYLTDVCNMKLSSVKIGMMLTRMIRLDNSIKNIRNKKCRIGIKESTDVGRGF
jgi:hypothetical protein